MRSGLSLLFGACVAALPFPDQADADCSCIEGIATGDIITKDVLIVGGGATGAYSAIRLRDDFKKSVIVIEKESRLGGHTETYIDPTTRRPVEIGVQVWLNETVTNAYLARLGVPTVGVPLTSTFTTEYADFKTGKLNTEYSPSQVTEGIALLEYAVLLQNYPYLAAGSYNLPDDIPEDLLIPFGQFVAKYQIQAALPIIFTFANGLGNLLEEPTIYVIQNIGLQVLQGLQGGGFLAAASANGNSELYNKAQTHLGADVLLNSVVKGTCRQDQGLNKILVQTPEGLKLIQAKKILVTIPPTLGNLKDFDIDSTEKDIFAQFHSSSLYSFLLTKTGIPDNTSVVNAPPNSATYNLPTAPFAASFDYTGTPGIHRSYAIGSDSLTKSDADQLIKGALSELGSAGTFHTNSNFQVAAFAAHTSLQARVTADAIKKGFYKSLYALQGHKGTFWTGSAWAADYSSILWQFTETVLPFVNATTA